MIPTTFIEANSTFKAPSDLEESQCMTIPAYLGQVSGGSCDGSSLVVVCWKPTEEERNRITSGAPIYLSCIGGLPPHFLSLSFQEASSPA